MNDVVKKTKEILTWATESWIIRYLPEPTATQESRDLIAVALRRAGFDIFASASKATEIMKEYEEFLLEQERNASMEEARREYAQHKAEKLVLYEQEECEHDEHDHGICLDCGKDVWDDVVSAAVFRAECLEDR